MFVQAFKTILITSAIATAAANPISRRDDSATAEIFPAGDCSGNSINSFSPPIGSSYYGQCTNFDLSGNYGAKFTSSSNCRFKSWELPDCHGKATVHVADGDNCIPIGNKNNALYLYDGAASLSVECDPDDTTITITLPPTTVTSTATATMTLSDIFHTGPPPSIYTQYSVESGFVGNDGTFGGVVISDVSPGTAVQAQSSTQVKVDTETEYFDENGERIEDTDDMEDGDKIGEEMGDSTGINEGAGGEEGEDTPDEHID